MASGIISILDDIAALMDDVAITSKIATRKTAGILGDDLAVNAEKATGFLATRELPVLWAITKGSLINKLIIVPVALLLTAIFPVAMKVILILGAFYLAYEGAEKIIEFLFHRKKTSHEIVEEIEEHSLEVEKKKIKSAITTDFILSVEIVVIALGTVLEESLPIQIITISVVALIATVGVYGLVAIIVRMDDFGYNLIKRSRGNKVVLTLGHGLVKALPIIIKIFAFVGTIALLLVSGGIFVHSIAYLHHSLPQVPMIIKEFFVGFVGGVIVVGIVKLTGYLFSSKR
jgi:predicted DNA repair protein MutK